MSIQSELYNKIINNIEGKKMLSKYNMMLRQRATASLLF
jgi:hypothetical protein